MLGVGKGLGKDGVAVRRGVATAQRQARRRAGSWTWADSRQHQVKLRTARSPATIVALGVGGVKEPVGVRRAGRRRGEQGEAPILKVADLGLVTDALALLPHLEAALSR